MSLSNTLEDAILNAIFMKASYTSPTNIWVGLHTGDPGEAGTANAESFTNGYARVSTAGTDWSASSGGSISNANIITFPTATADWAAGANFTHVSLWKHATDQTATNCIGSGALTTARNCLNGDTLRFAAGALTITLD